MTFWEIVALVVGSGAAGYIFGDRVRAYLAKEAKDGAIIIAKKL